MESKKKTASPSSTSFLRLPVVHVIWGLVCLTLMAQDQFPKMVLLYAAILGHGIVLLKSSQDDDGDVDDVTSCPNVYLAVSLVLAEFCLTCYNVTTRSPGIGPFVLQALGIAFTQVVVHMTYLLLSPGQVARHISLGEGRGRQKLKQQITEMNQSVLNE